MSTQHATGEELTPPPPIIGFMASATQRFGLLIPRGKWMEIGQNHGAALGMNWLVVDKTLSEKYEFVNWDDYYQYMGK